MKLVETRANNEAKYSFLASLKLTLVVDPSSSSSWTGNSRSKPGFVFRGNERERERGGVKILNRIESPGERDLQWVEARAHLGNYYGVIAEWSARTRHRVFEVRRRGRTGVERTRTRRRRNEGGGGGGGEKSRAEGLVRPQSGRQS